MLDRLRGVTGLLLGAVLLLSVSTSSTLAQAEVICQTPNGPKTTSQIESEIRAAGYAGPWDPASEAAAYGRAAGGPVTCGSQTTAASAHPIVVVLIAGYGSNLAMASVDFAPLQAALTARDPTVVFVQYSYVGSTVTGCASVPTPYGAADTAQAIDVSKKVLRDLLGALKKSCAADRIAVVGHSLGGLIGLQTLGEQPVAGVSDLATIDSPLGGVPRAESQACVATGFCADGPITAFMADLNTNWAATGQANAAKAAALAQAGTRATAWGNTSDCLYKVSLCSTLSVQVLGGYDSLETQWLGMPRAMRKDFTYPPYVWNIPASHTAVLLNSATDLAMDLLP